MEPAVVLCGLGRIGWRVLGYLQATGLPVVIVDTNCLPDDPRLGQARLIRGDCRSRAILEQAGVAQARGVLIMTNDDLVNISTALMVRDLDRSVRIVMRLFNQNLVLRLGKAVEHIFALSTSELTAPVFAMSALTGQALGTIPLEGLQSTPRQLAELIMSAASPRLGQTVAEFAAGEDLLVVAHQPHGEKMRLLLDVDAGRPLRVGDRLVLCGDPFKLAPLLEGGSDSLDNVLWAGWVRRMGRVAWRTLSEMDLAVKICTSILLIVLVGSTLVFHWRLERDDSARAFFRTTSLVATGADMHQRELEESPGLMVFVSGLRLVGAALIAAFTALVTNYLLRARLGGALEVRRIPDSGHVIVCGLGNIGFRIIEKLVEAGERVVAIELSRDNRFIGTARRLGVPVLVGDATVSPVLKQAHAVKARAVVAATSDDLVNLEVALMVRELNPKQRVVVHLADPNLAETLRTGANVRLALSIPALAAPAFVAALFGDRVYNMFMIDGRLLASLDLVLSADDKVLVGRTVRAVSLDYGLLPIAVADADKRLIAQPLDVRLEPGYRLVAISALGDLERLLRREGGLAQRQH